MVNIMVVSRLVSLFHLLRLLSVLSELLLATLILKFTVVAVLGECCDTAVYCGVG